MIFDVTAIGVLISLLMNSINLVIVIKNMLSAGEKKLEERVVKAETKMVDYDRRIQACESEIRHLPDKDTVNKLQVDMSDLKGQINSIMKTSEATERATRRVEEFLLRTKE